MNKYLNNIVGFDNLSDVIGYNAALLSKQVVLLSISFSWVFAILESLLGINSNVVYLFVVGNLFDLVFGLCVNVFYLKASFSTSKGFRGLFKLFIAFFLVYLTNNLRLSFVDISPDHQMLNTTINYITSTIHYFIVLLIGLYTILGIVENAAKLELDIFVKLAKILRMKIKGIEDKFTEGVEDTTSETNVIDEDLIDEP